MLLFCSSVSFFFQDFLEGNHFFFFFVKRVQTKRGILDQVHVPVASVFHGDLPRIPCQREELTANQHRRLMLGLQATGQGLLAGVVNSVLLLRANIHTQAQNIHARVVKPASNDTQTHRHSECSLACSCMDWSGELSILALIVLFYALAQGSLWVYTGAWVDEDARMKR